MAGGVPEVMLHLREMGLLNLDVLTVTGATLGEVLDWWESSERRQQRARPPARRPTASIPAASSWAPTPRAAPGLRAP